MNTSFLYPAGALTTTKQVKEREGQDVHVVLAAGDETETFKIRLGKIKNYVDNYTGQVEKYVEYYERDQKYKLYLLDVCIGNGHMLTMNYMFDTEDDADEYAEWAEENTINPKVYKKFFEGFDFF